MRVTIVQLGIAGQPEHRRAGFEMAVRPACTGAELKQAIIHEAEGVPSELRRLIFGQHEIADAETLAQCGVADASRILLVTDGVADGLARQPETPLTCDAHGAPLSLVCLEDGCDCALVCLLCADVGAHAGHAIGGVEAAGAATKAAAGVGSAREHVARARAGGVDARWCRVWTSLLDDLADADSSSRCRGGIGCWMNASASHWAGSTQSGRDSAEPAS